MIPVSPLFQEMVRYSHSVEPQVDLYVGNNVVQANIPVISGKVSTDLTSKTRYSCDLEMGLYPWDDIKVDVYKTRFKVYKGFPQIGERIQLGEYRVDDVNRNSQGSLSITGSGLESYVANARFLRPRAPAYGSSTLGSIASLITESVPRAKVSIEATKDQKVTQTKPWERERIDAIWSLADSLGVDVYAGYDGVFHIRDAPSLFGGVPVLVVDEGNGGVLVSEGVKSSRAKVYNAVSVKGDEELGIYGFAADLDPASPTYYNGEYGQVPRFYSSKYITTTTQANAVAKSMLAEAMARNRTVGFTSSPIAFLEAGDLIVLKLFDGSYETHMISTTSLDIGYDGALSVDTVATKMEPPESDEAAA